MSKITIIHIMPKVFVHGAYSLLSELSYAFNKYYSDKIDQNILCLSQDNNPKPKYYDFNFDCILLKNLEEFIKSKNNPVVFLHKIASTDCAHVSKIVTPICPLVIINVTACSNCRGLSKCDKLVCVSENMKQVIKGKFKKMDIKLIKNGVNACRMDSIEPIHRKGIEKYFISGRINNFNNTKHPNDWINWIKSIKISKPLWHDYIGEGAKFKTAQHQVRLPYRNKSNNNINLLGKIYDFDTKISYMKSWDAFLYEIPGREGISMSMLEAMACGIPVIINNRPGNNEIVVNGVNGWIYKDRSQAIKYLNTLSKDKSLRESMKKTSLEYFHENLDATHMAKSYYKLAYGLIYGEQN